MMHVVMIHVSIENVYVMNKCMMYLSLICSTCFYDEGSIYDACMYDAYMYDARIYDTYIFDV